MKADPAILDDARSVPGSAIAAKNRRVIHVILCLAIAYGVGSAYYRRWVCDDAFISYRYALNLVEGHGLVFNSGERVEGYTNFLWTLWCAVALLLKLPCEQWTMAWGIVFYGLSLGLLGYHFLLVRPASPVSPSQWPQCSEHCIPIGRSTPRADLRLRCLPFSLFSVTSCWPGALSTGITALSLSAWS
jgi:hypothetical protein